jgi:hypothetical protein
MTYSILVNTCDNFEDCWDPFFKLLSKYWPDCKGKIYLNTEYKDYSYPGLDIMPVKGCERNNFPRDKRATWSQCLIWALDIIDTDIVLYMQEDYFLKKGVNNVLFENELKQISDNDNIQRIYLLSSLSNNKKRSLRYSQYYLDNRNCDYYAHTQAALWKKNALISLIKTDESGWDFEKYATCRARMFPYNFYSVSYSQENPIMEYVMTGIVKGKWFPECVEVFKKNEILVDFSKRGFYIGGLKNPFCRRVRNGFYTIIKNFVNDFILIYLYFKFYKKRCICEKN